MAQRSSAWVARAIASMKVRAMALDAWRVVESQSLTATRKLVDSDAEQALLEQLVDRVKPPLPEGGAFRGLHYLLATPFRHPPLRWGSRFGTRAERGIWYGSKDLATCFAEVAYYRLLFLEGTAAPIAPITVELASFAAVVEAKRGVDLTRPPFAEHAAELASPVSYETTHAVGAALRAAGVEALLFVSARARARGINVALFEPAFGRRAPKKLEPWICTTDRAKVEISQKTFSRTRRRWAFPRSDFELGGRLPAPSD
ncbi:MAG TPA: RES family NAD+ phosphorylase [Polyangiaceae bacterium]|nr:RES family NAD+ phosphorylase [Polyangiaceae bacterium]